MQSWNPLEGILAVTILIQADFAGPISEGFPITCSMRWMTKPFTWLFSDTIEDILTSELAAQSHSQGQAIDKILRA
jgi:hypothetical protein